MEIQLNDILLLSKKEASQLAQEQSLELVETGLQDPLKAYIEAKKISEFYSEITKHLQKPALEETAKYGKDGAERWGAKASVVATPGRWDYSHTADEELSNLKAAAEQAKKAVEAREKFLQSLPATGMVLVDEATGDVAKIYPPAKITGETIKITY